MKKTFLTIFFAGTAFLGFSQLRFGAQIGTNISMPKYGEPSFTDYTYSSGSKVGFTAGLLVDMPLIAGLHFRPELNYTQKGTKITGIDDGEAYTDKYSFNYVDVPLNFSYNMKAGPGSLMFGIGPMVGFGIGGKIKSTYGPDTREWKAKFDGKKDTNDGNYHYKAIDFSLSSVVGYQLDMGPFISLGYNYGFNDIDPYDGYTWKNRSFYVKLGYTLGGASKTKKK